nr:hypothetical protein [Tanacetum cinerariifolium]
PTKPARKPKLTAPKAPPRPSVSTPVTSVQPVPTSAPAKLQEKKRKQATKTSNKPPKVAAEDADLQKALEESMKTTYAPPRGPLPPVVIRHDEPSYAELVQSEREESKKGVPEADERSQGEGEGQAGPDPGAQTEG